MLSNLVFHAQSTRTVQKTRAIKVEETDLTVTCCHRAQDLCDSGGGRRGLPVPNKLMVSVDVKQHRNRTRSLRVQELCESRGGRLGSSKPRSFCGSKSQ